MDLFRKNQKLIFWIVTIIIVPSFVLVWGVDRYMGNQPGMDFEVGHIGDQRIQYPEFEAFQKRFRAAIGGLPLQFTGAPGAGSPGEDLYKYMFTYSLLKDAEKAGFTASDLQIGTYLENGHPVISQAVKPDDPQAKDRAVDTLCRQMQINRAEFLRGIREWQTIGNYLDADANLSAVNDETVYVYYSLNKSEVEVKRIRFPEGGATAEKAKEEIMAQSKEDLEKNVRDYIAAHTSNARYREPAKWRFVWIMTPFVSSDSVAQPTEAEIRDRYEEGKSFLYSDQPLSEVRDRIRSEMLQAEIERQTLRNFTVDVDSQLRRESEVDLEELVKLAPMVKYGVTAGDTGTELLVSTEIVGTLPQGGDIQLQMFLDSIDSQPEAARDSMIEEWKSGFNLAGRPFRGDKGYYRMRLVDYVPSKPAEIDDADGNVKPEYHERAIEDMVGDLASEKAHSEALDMEAKIRAYMSAKERGEPAPDAEVASEFEALPSETLSYLQIADANYQLGRLPIGDIMGPQPYIDPRTGERGQELVVMVNRRVPSRETFEAEPNDVKQNYRAFALRNYQGNYGFTYTMNGPAALIAPSPTVMSGLANRFNTGQIGVNPDLIRTNEG